MYTVCKIRCQSRKSPGISAGYRALPPLRRAGGLLHAIAGYVSFVPCWRKSRREACHVLGRPLRVLRLGFRLPAGEVVRPGAPLLRRTRRSGGEGGNRPVRGERLRRGPRPPAPAAGSGGLPAPPLLLRSRARDALLPPAAPEVGGCARGGDPADARTRQPWTAGRSSPGGRGGDQLPGCAARGNGRGLSPDPDGGAAPEGALPAQRGGPAGDPRDDMSVRRSRRRRGTK